jgi:hypothetical protein
MRNDYCVYTHLRPDDSVFYVGKGIPSRPYRMSGRSSLWQAEVNSCGLHTVNIVKSNLTEKEAFQVEVRLIKMLRNSDIKIVNLTSGGDGCKDLIFTDEVKAKLKKARQNQAPTMLGKKWNEEQRREYRKKRIGTKNPMYGKKHTEEYKAAHKIRSMANLLSRTCPHCLKLGKGGSMVRWHMDNCKKRTVI